jgi:hypothetical protein
MSLPADETLRLITRDLNQTKGKMAHLDDRVTLLEQRFDKPWASLHFIDPRLIMLGLWITGGVFLIHRNRARHATL